MIREIQLKDKEQWEKLYRGYADFYKVEMNNKILQTEWNWLHDKNHEVDGLVYEVDGNIVGFAHYRRMPSPLRGQNIGFLDDLFVDPKYRGQKIGEKLINKIKEISKSKGWNLVRWITRNDNVRAKSLYDRVSEKTNWDVYELKWINPLEIVKSLNGRGVNPAVKSIPSQETKPPVVENFSFKNLIKLNRLSVVYFSFSELKVVKSKSQIFLQFVK